MKRWKQTVKELYGYVLSVVVFVCVLALLSREFCFFKEGRCERRGYAAGCHTESFRAVLCH